MMNFRLIFSLAIFSLSGIASAYSFGLNLGLFQPSDSIVRSVYQSKPAHFESRLGFEIGSGFSWVVNPTFYRLVSRVSDLESNTNFYILNGGFNQAWGGHGRIEAFVGAGIGYIRLVSEQENEASESHLKKRNQNSYGTYWEIGLNFPSGLDESCWLQAKILEQYIDYNLFGNINIGGKALSVGAHCTVN